LSPRSFVKENAVEQEIHKRPAKHLDNLPGGFPPTESGVEMHILKRLFTSEEGIIQDNTRHRIRNYPDAIGALQPIFHNPPTHPPVCFRILPDGCVPPAGDALDVSSPPCVLSILQL
jgi:hypothetical protein